MPSSLPFVVILALSQNALGARTNIKGMALLKSGINVDDGNATIHPDECDAKAMELPLGTVVKPASSKLPYELGATTYDRARGECTLFTLQQRLGRIKMWVYFGSNSKAPEICCTHKEHLAREAEMAKKTLAKDDTCVSGETYGLDENGVCHPDLDNDGNLDLQVLSPDECCLNCVPDGIYGRDDDGRCRIDRNKNGVLDRFAPGECCDCDTRPGVTYGRSADGRCRTDRNKNGILDRFAKDICCSDKDSYKPQGTFTHPTYGKVSTREECESQDRPMSTRNERDCIACVQGLKEEMHNPDRCTAT